MATTTWGQETAETYDATSAEMFNPEVLDPTINLLAELAQGGPALELAIGTGRVALPLSAQGIPVSGIELSPHMADQLKAKPGGETIPITIGDMTTTRVAGSFNLVYLIWNTIMNVTTQEGQVDIFINAAAHLNPGGHFVVEVHVAQPTNNEARVFDMTEDHVGIDTYDDPVGQILSSHHWTQVDGRLIRNSAQYRYVYPSELTLMGRLAGLHLTQRWASWRKEPFTATSTNQIAVFKKETQPNRPEM